VGEIEPWYIIIWELPWQSSFGTDPNFSLAGVRQF